MVAFSSASMANTIADEEVVTEEKKEVVVVRKTDCCLIYDLAYDLAISEVAPAESAESTANIAYNNCEKTAV
ncbi:hypothetical protein B0A61_13260 [Flavobacterium aquatile LMG 4008 = ATCC 11947]|uniref:Uncharacterized protein n=2 Tax=Flavobacterium aquatile TaxID=245 RepID=A0A095SW50_9FLAO|nr:hypothetical protein [Flavobacterium aquatile]KGD68906.1 hypothetical protein LG45_04490 [Flavobacterium aquatile LMG 4008 = ATCC 11947]OXA65617.1 hypothetical protein B0A61_13260 [Flavobacterium aquatile LMG 4008 = ATCC 11947]GEC80231.1 hypothetical protein FAQ01_31010 [Flavobacterium aquatile]